MKVYVVTSGCIYEGGGVDGVFATPEAAMPTVRKEIAEWRKHKQWCEENSPHDTDEIEQTEQHEWRFGSDYVRITEWEVAE